mgnify:FL=1
MLPTDANPSRKKETMITDQELKIARQAESLGVDIAPDTQGLLLPGDLGGWFPHARRILFAPGLGYRNRIHTMAHELGHAIHGHPAGHDPRHERQADDFAANLLIDPHAYIEAEAIYEGNERAIAHELGITLGLLQHWKTQYERKAA